METTHRIEQALNLKQEVAQFADLMLQLNNSDEDKARQKDRVRIKSMENNGSVLSGAVRFKKCGGVRALGIRQSELGTASSVELTLRTLRTKTAIVKKTVDPNRHNYAKVATAWFRLDGEVIRYQEETRRLKSSA
jgi:hypothetical protein